MLTLTAYGALLTFLPASTPAGDAASTALAALHESMDPVRDGLNVLLRVPHYLFVRKFPSMPSDSPSISFCLSQPGSTCARRSTTSASAV